MTEAVSRHIVDAFYAAYRSRDPERVGALLDENVEWYVGGPIEVMGVCGSWRGKAAVMNWLTRIVPPIVQFKSLEIESLLVDGDSSALFGCIACIHRKSGRLIRHRVAHNARYRNGKVVYFRVVNDTLDAAEQFIGHRIDFSVESESAFPDLIAV
jgi:ketosteroid isomerase-like protein